MDYVTLNDSETEFYSPSQTKAERKKVERSLRSVPLFYASIAYQIYFTPTIDKEPKIYMMVSVI